MMSSHYTICDISKPKSVKITNQNLHRDVDVVTSCWYDSFFYVLHGEDETNRAISIYNKETNTDKGPDYPFLSISRINNRSAASNGRLKRMIRFLKNVRSDSDKKIDLTSFEINAICYDIRFPELWTLMCDEGCDIILLPGAFNKTTGPAHWSTLIRARALDNEFYVAATSPSQVENPYYTAWGHSMVVSPWGEVLNSCIEEEEIIYTNITRSLLDKMRNEIPCLKNKRKDVYETIRK